MVSGALLELQEEDSWCGKCRRFCVYMYNPVDGTVMGRKCWHWIQFITFYLLFYACVAVFFGVGLYIFLNTLNSRTDGTPKWTCTDSSLMGASPGMGFGPKISANGTSLFWVNGSNSDFSGENEYIQMMNDFMAPYNDSAQTNSTFIDCTTSKGPDHSKKEVCKVKMSDLGPCAKDATWGFSSKTPCIALKLNRMINWVPAPFNDTNLPEANTNITGFYTNVLQQSLPSPSDKNSIYITCQGDGAEDVEHMGPITLHPKTIPAYYYPFLNTPGYLSPLVMLQFLNPQNGIVIHVRCEAYAGNLGPSETYYGVGIINFELLVSNQWSSSY